MTRVEQDDPLREGARAHYSDPAYYDRVYRRRRRDVAYYVARAQQYGGPVLELGCGTGRITLPLAKAGLDVVGVDALQAVLDHGERKRQKLAVAQRQRVRWVRGDMRSVRLRRRFPLIFAPFNVFMHLYTRRDVERALHTCAMHLRPDGHLIFDVAMPDMRALQRDPERLYRCRDLRNPDTGARYHYREAFSYDAQAQIQRVSMVFQSSQNPQDIQVQPLTQRLFYPAEIEALLHYNGFVVDSHTGDFRDEGLARDDESQVIVARKLSRRQPMPREP